MRGLTLALATLMLTLAGAVHAQAPETPRRTSCFFATDFENWKPVDTKTLIIRVNLNRYYRLGLAYECPEVKWPAAHLIMNVRGPNTICTPVDWDLKVSTNPQGITMPCIVKTMEELTPAEVSALPKGTKP